jgi:hypothetical protein
MNQVDRYANILYIKQALQLYMTRLGYDGKIWNVLAESETPLSLAQIADETGFDHTLLSMLYNSRKDFLGMETDAEYEYRACPALLPILPHDLPAVG